MWMLWKCRSWGLTQVQDRRRRPGASHAGSGFLVMRTLPSAMPLESVSSWANDCAWKDVTIGESISEIVVCKHLYANHRLLSFSTRRWVESQSFLVTKVACSKRAPVLRRRANDGSRRRSAVHNITVELLRTKKTNVYNIHMRPIGKATGAMPLSLSSGELRAGSEPVRQENPNKPGEADGANPGGAHDDSVRNDAVDGEELTILRVPRLLSQVQDRSPNTR